MQTYKQSNTMKGFVNETGCANRVLIRHVCIYLKLSIKQIRIEVSVYCRKNRFVILALSIFQTLGYSKA